MTLSGVIIAIGIVIIAAVLIPLLVDDPLREAENEQDIYALSVLIPLLVDDPLRGSICLWIQNKVYCLNPSFSG